MATPPTARLEETRLDERLEARVDGALQAGLDLTEGFHCTCHRVGAHGGRDRRVRGGRRTCKHAAHENRHYPFHHGSLGLSRPWGFTLRKF